MGEAMGAVTVAASSSARSFSGWAEELGLRGLGAGERRVLDALPVAVAVVARSGRAIYENPAARRLGGTRALPVTRDLWADLWDGLPCFGADDRESFAARAAGGESFDRDVQFFRDAKHPGGRWLSGSGRPLVNEEGALLGGVLLLEDVSDRRTGNHAIAASEERFRGLLRQLDDAVWIMTPDVDRVLYMSPAFTEIFGIAATEVYSSPLVWWRSIHPEDRIHAERARARLAAGEPTDEIYRVCRPDGELRWVRERGFPLSGRWGEVERLAGVLSDVTDLIQTREALEVRTEALTRSNEDLERYAHVASHDMQEPLRMIANHGHLLLAEEGEQLSARGRARLEHVRESSLRMQRLVRDLLDYSTVHAGPELVERVDLFEVVEIVLRDLELLLEQSEAEVEIEPPLPVVEGDLVQWVRLVTNLVANAVRHHGQTRPHIRVRGGRSSSSTWLEVEDEGPGVSEADRERIFAPLVRGAHSRGSGLGLSIARRIAEHHGGRLELHPGRERGSRFRVELPVSTEG